MNELGKRLLFRLVRILLIAGILMAGLVMLNPDRYLAPDAIPADDAGGLQAGLLVAAALAAVGVRVWISQSRKKRERR